MGIIKQDYDKTGKSTKSNYRFVFSSGDYEILVLTSNSDAITAQITNTITGEVTVIEVPRYGG